MSQGSTISNAESIRSQGDPMEVIPSMPFDQPTGPQFNELRNPVQNIPPQYHFQGFRDNTQQATHTIPIAPRYVDAYGRPFNQWPPARQGMPMPQQQGTFDNLRISDPMMQLPPPFRPQEEQNPLFAPAPVFANPPRQHMAVQHQQYQPIQYAPVAPVPMAMGYQQYPAIAHHPTASPYPMVVAQPMQRELSIDAINISHTKTQQQIPLLQTVPQPLSLKEKCLAFLGDDLLLKRQADRQAYKRLQK